MTKSSTKYIARTKDWQHGHASALYSWPACLQSKKYLHRRVVREQMICKRPHPLFVRVFARAKMWQKPTGWRAEVIAAVRKQAACE